MQCFRDNRPVSRRESCSLSYDPKFDREYHSRLSFNDFDMGGGHVLHVIFIIHATSRHREADAEPAGEIPISPRTDRIYLLFLKAHRDMQMLRGVPIQDFAARSAKRVFEFIQYRLFEALLKYAGDTDCRAGQETKAAIKIKRETVVFDITCLSSPISPLVPSSPRLSPPYPLGPLGSRSFPRLVSFTLDFSVPPRQRKKKKKRQKKIRRKKKKIENISLYAESPKGLAFKSRHGNNL
ncbi:hypothetical protein PUN28_000669 [Cardiocondyla obscurior]|uniref:Uncharacterized protein n=1 Tax=Cardiocondyla obscurior TaxID=286306 RepID=A0AAW2H132_9HYME